MFLYTVMALGPAFHMSQELTGGSRALPVLKVIYRNATRIQECGGRQREVLHRISVGNDTVAADGDRLRERVRSRDMEGAERMFAGMAQASAEGAFNALLHAVQDATEVHRVVLPYRAWDLAGIIGREHAHALLRQSVRYCVRAESPPRPGAMHPSREVLPALFDAHHLHGRSRGDRVPDAAGVEGLSKGIFESTPSQAAGLVAAALNEGWVPTAIRGNLQARASALIHRYGELGYPERPVFDLMLRYAVSEDGSLHAEKYYRTVREEFDATRLEFRWRHLVGLARVTASEYGRPAPGIDEARRLLRLG